MPNLMFLSSSKCILCHLKQNSNAQNFNELVPFVSALAQLGNWIFSIFISVSSEKETHQHQDEMYEFDFKFAHASCRLHLMWIADDE